MTPKEFIKVVLIDEMNDIVEQHPYIAFALIAIGIEFLGKCHLTEHQDWNNIKPDKAFNKGLDLLIEEEPTYGNLDLKNELRNGFAHTLLPKSKIALSEIKNGAIHFSQDSNGTTILVVEILFRDFVRACFRTLMTDFPVNDKMNEQFLSITDMKKK